MTYNLYTGHTGESDIQIERRIRKANPFLDEASIQQLITNEASTDLQNQRVKQTFGEPTT